MIVRTRGLPRPSFPEGIVPVHYRTCDVLLMQNISIRPIRGLLREGRVMSRPTEFLPGVGAVLLLIPALRQMSLYWVFASSVYVSVRLDFVAKLATQKIRTLSE